MPARDGTGSMNQRYDNENRPDILRTQGNGLGANGDCECPECGAKVAHQRGVPCTSINCPKCNTIMLRGD